MQQDVIQDVISLKTILVREEAVKAKRRAAHKGKAYGKLLWLLLRHAQRDPCTETALSLLTTRLGTYSVTLSLIPVWFDDFMKPENGQ